MSASITFYGGAGTVTGANFLLDTHSTDSRNSPQAGSGQVGGGKILIDCGARERERTCDPENLKPFAYDPASIDALFITHAHQDHIGRVPRLVREGFKGKIFSTPATKELSAIMFDDALKVMHEEAQRHSCEPLYDAQEVERTLGLWRAHAYGESFEIGGAKVEFLDAGHILGSAMIKLSRTSGKAGESRSILFTGDLGNSPEPLLRDTQSPEGANYLVMESVYGDRVHEDRAARRALLGRAIERAREKGGTLLIPSFSLERTQILLYEINELIEHKEIEPIPVYLDAPLAERITGVFEHHKEDLNENVQEEFRRGGNPFTFPGLEVVADAQESKAIHNAPSPKVIIAGAGMSAGGRIRLHERKYLGDQSASVLLVGYQAPGSLGRRIQDGERFVEIDGEKIRVRARIDTLTGYSGHADRDQLLQFAENAGPSLKEAFVVMGEPRASLFLAQRLKDFLGIRATVPAAGESVEIDW